METVLKVCKKEIVPKQKKIVYSDIIEKGINDLEHKLNDFSTLPKYLHRWTSIKILDGEEKILKSIEKNFSISLIDNVDLNISKLKVINNLKISINPQEKFRDSIVTSIVNECETVCKKVCTFENKNYSRKRSKD